VVTYHLKQEFVELQLIQKPSLILI